MQAAHSQSMGFQHTQVKYLNAGLGLKLVLQPISSLQTNLEHLKGFAELRLSSPSSHSSFRWGRLCRSLQELYVCSGHFDFKKLKFGTSAPEYLKEVLKEKCMEGNWKYPSWKQLSTPAAVLPDLWQDFWKGITLKQRRGEYVRGERHL